MTVEERLDRLERLAVATFREVTGTRGVAQDELLGRVLNDCHNIRQEVEADGQSVDDAVSQLFLRDRRLKDDHA